MKWPWSRKTHSPDAADAKRAAEEHLREAEAQWPEVYRVAGSLRDLRKRNGFAEQLEYILRGGHGGERR